jgi:hypothetical protein
VIIHTEYNVPVPCDNSHQIQRAFSRSREQYWSLYNWHDYETVTLHLNLVKCYAVTYTNLYSAVTVRTTLAKCFAVTYIVYTVQCYTIQSTTSLPTVRNETVKIHWTWLSCYAVTYSNLHSAVRTTLAKLRSHIRQLYSAVLYNTIENLVTHTTPFEKKNPSIPCTPWDTEHQHPHQRKVTTTTRKYMATIHPAYTPYHYTQASYPLYIFLPHRMNKIFHTSEHIHNSLHRQLTILLLNCKTN